MVVDVAVEHPAELLLIVGGPGIDFDAESVQFGREGSGEFSARHADAPDQFQIPLLLRQPEFRFVNETVREHILIHSSGEIEHAGLEADDRAVAETVPAFELPDYLPGADAVVLLQLDAEIESGTSLLDEIEHFRQRRDARSGEFRRFPAAEIETAQLFEGEIPHPSGSVAAAVDPVVVRDDQFAVPRHMNVEFDGVDVQPQRLLEGRKRVLRVRRGKSAMGDQHLFPFHDSANPPCWSGRI